MKLDVAANVKQRALVAVAELHSILTDIRNECSSEDFQLVKRGVGLSIGTIEIELLQAIYRQYPEIDDLKDLD
jgi:hypothetical protein